MYHLKISALALLLLPLGWALPALAQTRQPEMRQPGIKIGTLAPEGTNHDLNSKRYIVFHKLNSAKIVHYDSFLVAADDLESGKIDKIIILPAHPEYRQLVAEHVDTGKIFMEECFKGPVHGMGLLKRRGWSEKDSVAFMPVTKGAFDSENFKTLKTVRSNVDAGFQLMAGVTNWAYTFTSFAHRYPSQVEIVTEGPMPRPGGSPAPPLPVDPQLMGWQVYSTTRPGTPVTACREPTAEELAIVD